MSEHFADVAAKDGREDDAEVGDSVVNEEIETAPSIDSFTNGKLKRENPKPGILRLDVTKPRRSSGGSVEFKEQPQVLDEDTLGQFGICTPHQLSVTWASQCVINEPGLKSKPMQVHLDTSTVADKRKRSVFQDDKSFDLASPVDECGGQSDLDDDNVDEDYSISVSAIMQRRASVRGFRNKHRNSRRASSPMDHVLDMTERRRSSVYTTSSDEGTNQESTQEQIFENIRLHKEVIQSVKLQPWNMRKKLKLVRQAKTYVARHEGALQERFAMSRSTRDLWARFKILMAARWKHWKRETASILNVLTPWELRIKEIESHFGSGVASYFTFLRWLLWVNIMIAIPLVAFVIAPELLSTNPGETDPRKKMTSLEMKKAGDFLSYWEFEGYLKYSPLFYGYYSAQSGAMKKGYNLPLAYFLTAVIVYIYSFVAILRKMAGNSRNSKLSSKDDECIFSWKLFTGWDFMIGHAETAHNRIASVVVGFKEALLEEAEKKKDKRNWRIILQRILVNILIIALLVASGGAVVWAVGQSEDIGPDDILPRNLVNYIITSLSVFLPMLFEALGLFENWHPRQQLRLQLARIMILNLLNLYSLMFSFIYKIDGKDVLLQLLKEQDLNATNESEEIKRIIANIASRRNASPNAIDMSMLLSNSSSNELLTASTLAIFNIFNQTRCYTKLVNCSKPKFLSNQTLTTSMLLLNLSTTILPLSTVPMMWTKSTSSFASSSYPPTTLYASTTPVMDYIGSGDLFLTTTTDFSTESDDIASKLPLADTDADTEELTATGSIIPDVFETTTLTDYTLETSSSSLSPVNDSYFEYYDYFDSYALMEDTKNEELKSNDGVLEKIEVVEDGTPKTNDNVRRLSRDLHSANSEADSLLTAIHSKQIKKRSENSESGALLDASYIDYDKISTVDGDDGIIATSKTGIEKMTKFYSTNLATPTENPSTIIHVSGKGNSDIEDAADKDDINQNKSRSWNSNLLRDKVSEYIRNTMTVTAITDSPTSKSISTQSSVEVEEEDQNINLYFQDSLGATDNNNLGAASGSRVDSSSYSYFTNDNNDNRINCTQTVCVTESPDYLTIEQYYEERLANVTLQIEGIRQNLSAMCWETTLGQELSKVIVLDMVMSIAASLCIDFLRALFVRYMNQHWCWDMEKTFPQYGDFKIAESILNLVYNQGQVWMGIFFSPGLVIINLVKLMILMYFRSWIVLTCNVPHEVVFKASKSNNFYLSLLLTMLFLCVLPVSYAIVWLRPSWHCGPFSEYNRISEFFSNTTITALPKELRKPWEYITSSSTVIPLLLLLILIIYYLVSLTGALRESNQDLKTQLQKEREEERRKMFKAPEIKTNEQAAAALSNRWRKVLEASSPGTPTQPPDFDEYKTQARKELISRIMKKALRKSSATSEEESIFRQGRDRDEDDTDTEHQDSLPLDDEAKEKMFHGSKMQHIGRSRKPSLVEIVQIAKSERDRINASGAGAKEAHAKGRFRVEKIDSVDNGNDPEVNSRIVSERRESLLRRNHKPQAGTENSKQNSNNQSIYTITNEKNTKKPKSHFSKSSTEPNVFRFDNKFTYEKETSRSSDNPTIPTAHLIKEDTAQQSELRNDLLATAGVHKAPNSDKLANISKQGRKKLGSLLTLVREAVNIKRLESETPIHSQSHPSKTHEPNNVISKVIPTAAPKASDNNRAPLEDPEEYDQPGPIPNSAASASQRRKTIERAAPMRQDSQTSVWSDNIPTITISATGSDECILEANAKQSASTTTAINVQNNVEKSEITCNNNIQRF